MNSISVKYTLVWQVAFAPNYQLTQDGKMFNTKTCKRIKQSYNSGSIGYNIRGKFHSLSRLRNDLVRIPRNEIIPF